MIASLRKAAVIITWDRLLQWLHILMLMDDTIILATRKERLYENLSILQDFGVEHNMKGNATNTTFMMIHGDKMPISFGDIVINLCERYVYLFTWDGCIQTV